MAVDQPQQICFEYQQLDLIGPSVLDGVQPLERRAVAAELHFDIGGAQVVVERLWRPTDCLLGLNQGIGVVAEFPKESRVMTPDFGTVGLLAQQLREALEGSGGIPEPREHDRDLCTRLPE